VFDLIFTKKKQKDQKLIYNLIVKNKYKPVLFGNGVILIKTFEFLKSKKIQMTGYYPVGTNNLPINLKKITSGNLKQYIVIICCEDLFLKQAKQRLLQFGCKNVIFYFDCFYNVGELTYEDYKKYFPATFAAIHNLFISKDFYSNKKIFPYVELVITEKCNLRCRHCANLMQYYKNPVDENLDIQMKALTNFIKIVGAIHRVRIIGGEPFLNKQLGCYLERIFSSELKNSIMLVEITTNGTILPDNKMINLLKKYPILLTVSDYKLKSVKLKAIQWQSKKVNYFLSIYKNRWNPCGSIKKRERQETLLNSAVCLSKTCNTIKEGKFYPCPFIAHAIKLKAIPKNCDESIDLINSNPNVAAIYHMRNKIYFKACTYCHIMSNKNFSADFPVQLQNPLSYTLCN
jgi:organic radical activating enzyme